MRSLIKFGAFAFGLAGLVLGLSATPASAAPIVYNLSPAWVQVGAGPTWVLPAVIPGCGSENEPNCEPAGDFVVDSGSPWLPPAKAIRFLEPTGEPSDVILLDNTGPGHSLHIRFFSDPSFPDPNIYAGYNISTITENASGAVIGPLGLGLTGFPAATFTLASDGEGYFDPFGAGFDTSDGIQFSGVTTPVVPEPGSMLLFATGLAGVWRKRKLVFRS